MHFVMHAFSNHVEVLHNVTPIDFDIQGCWKNISYAVGTENWNADWFWYTGLLKKYRHCTNWTTMCHVIYENGRGGFIYPPYGTVPHKRNRLRPKSCKPFAAYSNNPSRFASPSHGYRKSNGWIDWWCRHNALGRIYKSAPTVGSRKQNE